MERVENKYGKSKKIIGKGGLGQVFSTDIPEIAIKISYYNKVEGLSDAFVKEVSIINLLNDVGKNSNIISIHDTYILKEEEKTVLVLPLAVTEFKAIKIADIRNRKIMIYQIMRGIAYMNSKHVMHYDLKPANILHFEDGSLKISDFGLSSFVTSRDYRDQQIIYTVIWRPIEVFLGEKTHNRNCDVWAVGIILIQLLTGELPFGNNYSDKAIFNNILRIVGTPSNEEFPNFEEMVKNRKLLYDDDYVEHDAKALDRKYGITDKDELDFLNRTFTWPNKRMDSMEALNHPYFDSIREIVHGAFPDDDPIVETRCDSILRTIDGVYDIYRTDDYKIMHVFKVFNWMITAYKKYLKIKTNTLLLSIIYFRKYLKEHKVLKSELQLIGTAALLLAVRMKEEHYIGVKELVSVPGFLFTNDELIDMSIKMFESFNYRCIKATVLDYLMDEEHQIKIPDKFISVEQYMPILLNIMPEIYNNYNQRQMAAICLESFEYEHECFGKSPIKFDKNFFSKLDKMKMKYHLDLIRDEVKKVYGF